MRYRGGGGENAGIHPPRIGAADLMFTHTSLREAMQATTSGSLGRPSKVTWMS